jgi:RNA-directed DNA polymerase
VDAQIFHALWRWVKRRHHNKGSKWIVRKYFHRINTRNWTFARQWKRDDGTTGYFALEYASDTKIVRFPGIRDGANPHDEEWRLYLEERETEKMRITVKGNHTLRYLFNKQRGCCALCGEKLTLETGGRCHKYKHGNASLNFLVHPDCHRKLHQFHSFQPAYCGSNRL